MSTYIDTSALAKWYFPEIGSEDLENWLVEATDVWASSLVRLEFQSLIARRRRVKELSTNDAAQVLSLFENDVKSGSIVIRTVTNAHLENAPQIFERCPKIGLRTLDALHLAIALDGGANEIATSDDIMGEAAKELSMTVHYFGQRRQKPARRK